MPGTIAPPAVSAVPPQGGRPPAWLQALEDGPTWMRAAAAALVAQSLFLLTPTGAATDGTTLEELAAAIRLTIEGGALLWAAARPELPGRVRLALRITAWTSLVTAVDYVLLNLPVVGAVVRRPAIDSGMTLAGYLGALGALLVYPRTPARPGERAALAIDTLVSVGGLGLLSWTLVTETSVTAAPDRITEWSVRVFGMSQLAMIAGLNLVIVRGRALPTARAFWWFIGGQALYVPMLLLTQLAEARLIAQWPADLVYFLGVLPTLVAAHLFRHEPVTASDSGAGPPWLRDLNPLPLAMALFVGVALLASLIADTRRSALPLAAALVAIALLLAIRLLLSAHRAGALAQEEAARERHRQAERLQAVSRLAGGIAHEFNNLMARIIGNAELGEASLPAGAEAREHFVRARAAATRAADLTSQLLAFSGQRHTRPTLVDAETAAHESLRRATHDVGAGIGVEFTAGPGPSAVLADPEQLRGAVEQVIANALEAMPQGGRLVVSLSRQVLDTTLESSVLSVPPGRYVVLTVADTGMGMSPDVVRIACEPFYSTKPAHLAAGLGLAVVHGFVTSHGGGLTIDSTPGVGTTVRLYLPGV